MNQVWQPIKVLGMKETNKGTILQVATNKFIKKVNS